MILGDYDTWPRVPTIELVCGIVGKLYALAVAALAIGLVRLRKKERRGHCAQTWQLKIKNFTLGLAIASSALLVWLLAQASRPLDMTAVFQLLSTCIALVLSFAHSRRSTLPSDTLLVYWLFSAIANATQLHSYVKHSTDSLDISVLIAYVAYLGASLTALWVEATAQPSESHVRLVAAADVDDKRDPAEQAHIFSRLIYAWATPAIDAGYRRNYLDIEHLYGMPRELTGDHANVKFLAEWTRSQTQPSPSLLKVMWNGTWRDVLWSGIYLKISVGSQLLQPLLLRRIITFFQVYGTVKGVELDDGLLLAAAMGVLGLVRATAFQAYWLRLMLPFMWVDKVLSALIFRKVLHLSNESRSKHTVGEIVSYLSVDADRIAVFVNYIHCLWCYPLQIAVVMYMLYQTIGWSCLAGVAMLAINASASTWLAGFVQAHVRDFFSLRDQRMRVITEAMNNMKGVKLYSWQSAFIDRISKIRDTKELRSLRKVGMWKAIMNTSSSLTTVLIGLVTFATYEVFDGVSHGPLTSKLIFVSLSYFLLIQEPISQGPFVMTQFINATKSYVRVCSLANSAELDPAAVDRIEYDRDSPVATSDDVLVCMEKGEFKWLTAEEPTLRSIDIECKRDQLVAVIGRVGAGKSSLVSAILGDMVKSRGSVTVRGSVAYVPQQAWIMNATLRDNILFGHRFDQVLYDRVLDACALRPDLEMLPGGDMTEIGEKGINLSGGQKARVSLARAAYSRADIYILDDPLAAVDAHVGKHIFTHVLGPQGMLKTRARILVTNAVQYLSNVDSVVMLRNGQVVERGSFSHVMDNRGETFDYISSHMFEGGASSDIQSLHDSDGTSIYESQSDTPSTLFAGQSEQSQLNSACASSNSSARTSTTESPSCASLHKIMKKEERSVGGIEWATIQFYLEACGSNNVRGLVASLALALAFNAGGSLWLARWSNANDRQKSENSHASTFYLAIYGLLGVAGVFAMAMSLLLLWMRCTLNASRNTHRQMLYSIFRSPMSFFDSTPVGRILGLFSGDIAQIDDNMPTTSDMGLKALMQAVVAVVLIVISAPLTLVFFLPSAYIYMDLQRRFLPTTRDSKRIANTMRDISLSTTEEAINGAASIRAYGQVSAFETTFMERTELNCRAWWTYMSANRWLAVRLDLVSAGIIFLTTVLLILTQLVAGSVNGSHAGLSLTYALSMIGVLTTCIRCTTIVELALISVERVRRYSFLDAEAPEVKEDSRPERSWPEQGMVEFKNYSTRYREGLDLVLKDVSFAVKPCEKVGIVGRTGAGKSSLTLALFRIIEAAEGQILLDGEDIAQYGLFDVRSKLSIIPQDPVLFAGTVRENLDPFNTYSDQDIWRALEHTRLADFIRTKDERLEFVVTQGGENFSVGQRQLICLARALLKRARILVLDEATAAIDPESDAIIQDSIRKEFKDCTVLTIAHRLNTIIDSDRILVLDQGQVAEFDAPSALLAKEGGLFKSLWESASEN
ncbi:hypothetical protein IWW37_003584 [Coemansia sp. RSA 2050]|nr:hypothetical protein IWW37_003584 [Coemansia sp. RSA 2050]